MAEEPKFESLDKQIQASEGVQQSYDALAKSVPNPFDSSQIGGMLMKSGQIIQDQFKQFQETITIKEKKLKEETEQAISQNTSVLQNTLSNINAGLDENGKPADWTPDQKIEKVKQVYQQYEEGLNEQYKNYNQNFLSKAGADRKLHLEHFGHTVKSQQWQAFGNVNKILFEQNRIKELSLVQGHINDIQNVTKNDNRKQMPYKKGANGKAMYDPNVIEATKETSYNAMLKINEATSTATVGNYIPTESKRSELREKDSYDFFSKAIQTSQNPHLIMDVFLEKDENGKYIAQEKLGVSDSDYRSLTMKLQHDTSRKMVGDIRYQIKLAEADHRYETKQYIKDGKTVEDYSLIVYNPYTGDRLANSEITKNEGIYKYLDQTANPSSESQKLLLSNNIGNKKSSDDKGDINTQERTISFDRSEQIALAQKSAEMNGITTAEAAKKLNFHAAVNSPDFSKNIIQAMSNIEPAKIGDQFEQLFKQGKSQHGGGLPPELADGIFNKISNREEMKRLIDTLAGKGEDWDLVNKAFASIDTDFNADSLKDSPTQRAFYLKTLGNAAYGKNSYYQGDVASYIKLKSLGIEVSEDAEKVFLNPNYMEKLSEAEKNELPKEKKARQKAIENSPNGINALLKAGVVSEDTAKLFAKTTVGYANTTWGGLNEQIRSVMPNYVAIGTPHSDTMYIQRNIENTRALAVFSDIKNQTATGNSMKGSRLSEIQNVIETQCRQRHDELMENVMKNKQFQAIFTDPSIGTTLLKQDPNNNHVFTLAAPIKEKGGEFKNITTSKEGKVIQLILPKDKDGRVITDCREKMEMVESDTAITYFYPSSKNEVAIITSPSKQYKVKNIKSKEIK